MKIDLNDFITTNPKILFGKPVFKGTRIPVDLILEKLGWGETPESLLEAYPRLTLESIRAGMLYGAMSIRSETLLASY